MNVLLSCHVSRVVGMGHFMRQLNIAMEMMHRGYKVTFTIPSYNPALNLLHKNNLSYIKSTKIPFEVPPELDIDIFVLDINDTDDNYIKTQKKNCKKVISFDDKGSGRNHVDLLIDSNLDSAGNSKIKGLFGPKYVILHNHFSAYKNLKKRIPEKVESVAVSMGGTDPRCIGPTITGFLLKSGINVKIDLILGAGFNDTDIKPEDQRLIQDNHHRCKVYKNLVDIAEIFFNADFAICSGGITLYEACAVGTPALVINQAKHQQKTALRVQNRGAAINFGMWRDSTMAKLPQILKNQDCFKRKKMSIAGKNMVDGNGLQRVINQIETLLNTGTALP